MLLSIKDLRVHYDKVEAVKGVSLEVEQGTIVTLIGANGAGKSTVLKAISGLKHPTSGEVWFEGKRIDRLAAHDIVKAGISHVPEGRRLFPNLTVEQNLKIGAYLRRDAEEVKNDMEVVFQRFPILKERAKQEARTMSGGEQQMLAIGRALMSKPKLMMLDEPSLGLAPLFVKEIAKIVLELNRKGLSIILVEQNAVMALRLASMGYVMETGKVAMSGRADSLLHDDHVRKAYLGG